MKEKILEDKEFLDLYNKRLDMENKLKGVQAEVYQKLEDAGIWIGDWECDNPIGKCIYHWDDVMGDECLICHQPDERK